MSEPARLNLAERFEEIAFRFLTSRNVVYNTSWEDPAVDRRIMHIAAGDRILVITSAGCNALDYALESPAKVIAVDANPHQTALLELKIAAIRHLSYEDMFALFGLGWHRDFPSLYQRSLRADLSEFARKFWDGHQHWFTNPNATFYTHGLSGLVMRGFQWRLRMQPALRTQIRAMFDQPDLEAQRSLYLKEVQPRFWTPFMRWFVSTPFFLSLIGVPMPQRRLLHADSDGTSPVQTMIDELFCTVPAKDNYFWGVYVFGSYQPDRCPRYLTPDGFARLKAGLVDCIEAHTCTVTEYLERPGPKLTHAVLLDHMDWMSSYYPDALEAEWTALLPRMEAGGRILFRSAHLSPPFLDATRLGPERRPVRDWLNFRSEEALELSRADRVHTYTSFHVAEVAKTP